MIHESEAWLLFLLVEAGPRSADRVRVWRGLKALGPAVLRDGAYLLPARDELEAELAVQRAEVRRAGGQAFIFSLRNAPADAPELVELFDRGPEFANLDEAGREFVRAVPENELEARRALRALQREFTTLVATDYFPNTSQERARAVVAEADEAFVKRFSPGEPHRAEREIVSLYARDYQSRIWATRSRLWVDRVASAWLIRRFIDRGARFQWLADVRDRLPEAIGFDFDGATFTHVGDAVTFEVLMLSFDLGDDPGLAQLAKLVRSLDLTGAPRSPEAAGFEALLTGAREQCANDDELLEALSRPLDFLYAAFRKAAKQ